MIAGGSLESGAASDAIYAFTPATGAVRRIGTLPRRDARRRRRARPDASTSSAAAGRSRNADGAVDADRPPHGPRDGSAASPAAAFRPGCDRGREPHPPRRRPWTSGTVDTLLAFGPRAAHRRRHGGWPRSRRSSPGRTSTPPTSRATSRRSRAGRRARLRPEQPEQHGRRDRPAHVQGGGALRRSARCRNTSLPAYDLRTLYVLNDAGNTVTPIDPQTGQARRADPGRRPVQHVLHARRALRDRRRRAAAAPRLPRRAHD